MSKYQLFIPIKFEEKMSTEKLDKQIAHLLIYVLIFVTFIMFCFIIFVIFVLIQYLTNYWHPHKVKLNEKPLIRTEPKSLDVPKSKPIVFPNYGPFAIGSKKSDSEEQHN
jgi:hypothetical protein